MVRRAALLLAFTAAGLGAGGCFAVHDVDLPYQIDDFENGSYQPADPQFQPWGCYLVNAQPDDTYDCKLGAGDQSQYALVLDFNVDAPPAGVVQNVGAGLQTKARSPQDFGGLNHLAFDVTLTPGSPPLPTTATFYVYLGCSSAMADDGSVPGDLAVVYSEAAGVYWRTWSVNLTDFSSPSWNTTHIQGGTEACLKRVDSIQFQVDANLASGTKGAATLSVDNIYFE